jgi:hypothetical protein
MKHRFGMATVRRFPSVTNASTHRWRQELRLMAVMVGHPIARNAGRCDGCAWALHQLKIANKEEAKGSRSRRFVWLRSDERVLA